MPTWTTRDDVQIDIDTMATSHLLAAIHMIERKRLENLLSVVIGGIKNADVIEYYVAWPNVYEDLCDEAVKRKLIKRGTKNKKLKGKK